MIQCCISYKFLLVGLIERNCNKYSKILISFCSQIKYWLSELEVRIANREDPHIRLLLKKQSDLSLHCLSRPYWQGLVSEILEHLLYIMTASNGKQE